MIEPSTNKGATPPAQTGPTTVITKKKKKKIKTGAAAPAPVAPAATPGKKKKVKKAAGSTPKSAQLFRDGSMASKMYDKLKDGKEIAVKDLFKGLDSGDPHRLLTDVRNRGKKTGEFTIVRTQPGHLKLETTA